MRYFLLYNYKERQTVIINYLIELQRRKTMLAYISNSVQSIIKFK